MISGVPGRWSAPAGLADLGAQKIITFQPASRIISFCLDRKEPIRFEEGGVGRPILTPTS